MSVLSNRRRFIQGVATTIAVGCFRPTIILRDEIDREAILKRFCDPGRYCSRFDLAEPFALGSQTYATDSRWMVRTELASTIDDGESKIRPRADFVYDQFWNDKLEFREFEMPRLEDLHLGYSTCPVCHDRRIDVRDDWASYVSAPDYDPDDGTIKDRSCHWCWDQKHNWPIELRKSLVKIDGRFFSADRMQTVLSIPNVRVAVNQTSMDQGVLMFEGAGFQGLLCGCNPRPLPYSN